MKRKIIFTCFISLLFIVSSVAAQTGKKGYFNFSSPVEIADKNYGVLNIAAEKHTVVIGTIMAYGENVKGLTIQINNGFPFKLAPSQNGSTLNYVGSTLNIVLQPGDKARIEFINTAKATGARQLYAAGETIE
jgi:hypothetical protein